VWITVKSPTIGRLVVCNNPALKHIFCKHPKEKKNIYIDRIDDSVFAADFLMGSDAVFDANFCISNDVVFVLIYIYIYI
jgi:hypothetical protein